MIDERCYRGGESIGARRTRRLRGCARVMLSETHPRDPADVKTSGLGSTERKYGEQGPAQGQVTY